MFTTPCAPAAPANKDLILSVDSPDQPLLPGSTYYLLVTNDGEDDMVFKVKLQLITAAPAQEDAGTEPPPPPPEAEAGTDAGVPPPSASAEGAAGGGCRASGQTATPIVGLWALALAALIRRRRRRRT